MKIPSNRWVAFALLVIFTFYFLWIQNYVLGGISLFLCGGLFKRMEFARKSSIGFFVFIAIALVFVFFPMNVEYEGTVFYEMNIIYKVPLLLLGELFLLGVILTIRHKFSESNPTEFNESAN